MMTAVGLIGAILVLEARPIYTWLGARSAGEVASPRRPGRSGSRCGRGCCLLATFIPLRIAQRRLEAIER